MTATHPYQTLGIKKRSKQLSKHLPPNWTSKGFINIQFFNIIIRTITNDEKFGSSLKVKKTDIPLCKKQGDIPSMNRVKKQLYKSILPGRILKGDLNECE